VCFILYIIFVTIIIFFIRKKIFAHIFFIEEKIFKTIVKFQGATSIKA